ncbi:MAG: hypothetical protein ACJ8F7_10475 [Gemmataceae bacterium]
MSKFVKSFVAAAGLTAILAAGCNQSASPVASNDGPPVSGEKYLLTAEPAGAKGVSDVRKDATDGDDVVMVGRIGGTAKPWVAGRAAFQVVDPALKSCADSEGDNCPTPWDYCCTPREDLIKAMATVKVVDYAGQTVPADARDLLDLKELQTVVIRGKAKRDSEGNLTVLATGIYRRPDGKK